MFDPHDLYTGERFSKVLSTLTAVNKATEGKKKMGFFPSRMYAGVGWLGFFCNSEFMVISGGSANCAAGSDAGWRNCHFVLLSASSGLRRGVSGVAVRALRRSIVAFTRRDLCSVLTALREREVGHRKGASM